MIKNKIIVKISEGLGNQLFMYANAYCLAQKYNLDLFIDIKSGYYNDKSIYPFMLDNFSISSNYAQDHEIFNSSSKNFIKKFLIYSDIFKKNKKFFFENKDKKKKSFFLPLILNSKSPTIYIDGNFESEKYFIDYKDQILNEFKIIL